MNERIRELAEQARKKSIGNSWCYTNPEEFEQKFAELLIQDCVNELLKWKSEPFPLDAESAARIIQEHFGVER